MISKNLVCTVYTTQCMYINIRLILINLIKFNVMFVFKNCFSLQCSLRLGEKNEMSYHKKLYLFKFILSGRFTNYVFCQDVKKSIDEKDTQVLR